MLEREGRLAFGISEIANGMGISVDSIKRQINLGNIRTVFIGGRRVIPRAEVDRLMLEGTTPLRRPRVKKAKRAV